MPEKTKRRDDERVREGGFVPEGNIHLGEMISGVALWHHPDEPNRSFTLTEALERLERDAEEED